MRGARTARLLDRRIHYVSNFLGRAHTVISGSEVIAAGEHVVILRFTRTGNRAGKAVLEMDGRQVDEADIPKTNPMAYAAVDGLEIGSDSASPIWPA